MKSINDELLDEVNGGVVVASEKKNNFSISLPMFTELAKEAGLVDIAKIEALYPVFKAARGLNIDKLVNVADNHESALTEVRQFLASPAAMMAKK